MARKNRVQPGVPTAVLKASADADKLHAEIYGTKEKTPPSEQEQQGAEAPAENDAGSGGDIQPVEPQAQKDSTGDTSGAAVKEGEGGATTKELPSPTEKPDGVSEWESKYRVLQGKYNAEIPAMSAQIREMKDQLKELSQAQTKAPEPKSDDTREKDVVSDADIVDYGEDLVNLIRRVARSEAERQTSNLTPQLEQIRGQVTQSAKSQTTNTVYSKLDAEVQDWRAINKSPDFLEWLATPDPYAGDYRKNLLGAAFESGDANRVAAFFKGYLAERQAVAPKQTTTEVPSTAPKTNMSLEKLAGPSGGTTSGDVNTQPEAPQPWTRAQIGQFYNDVSAGVFAKDPQQKAKIEASIAAALRAGAIT